MDFKRARSDEQKSIRIGQITDVARRLFETNKYEDISLAGIAKGLSFTRANLYKYVSSKEEIFLYIIMDDLSKWTKNLNNKFADAENPSIKNFSLLWVESLEENKEMIKILSILYTIIEKNVTVERLTSFKIEFFKEMQEIFVLIKKIFPMLSQEKISKFLQMQLYFVMGLYPATTENAIQREAIAKAKIPYEQPDLSVILYEFTVMLLNNLTS